ncbi:lipid II flippase MurJ [Demequina aurantiaca]|uniref:lipid II flippase MurJ n=1 Tax=Demequina aurantiaca TaxID=676200 RepID=UPI003D32E312
MRRAALSLFAGGLAGKLLGILREVLLAAAFGISAPVAAFRTAQTATLAPVNFFTADALSAGFVPIHARFLVTDPRRAAVYYRAIRDLLLGVSVVLALALWIWRDVAARLIAPGFDASTGAMTALMLGVMAVGIPPYIYTALASYLEMSHGVYRIASVRASAQSVGLIVGVGLAVIYDAPVWLAGGFTGAYVGLAAWSATRIHRSRLAGTAEDITPSERREAYATLWRIVRPLVPLPFLLQGAIVVERMISTLLGTGATASLDYARVISDTLVVLIATPLGLASLSAYANKTDIEVKRSARKVVRLLVFVGAGPAVVLAFLGTDIVGVVFGRGAFDARAEIITGKYLLGLSFGLAFQLVAYFLIKVLNSRRRNREVLAALGLGSVTLIAVDLALFRELGALGIGIGASAGALVQTVVAASFLGLMPALLRACLAVIVPVTLSVMMGIWGARMGLGGIGVLVAFAAIWLLALWLTPSLRNTAREMLSGWRT